MKILSWGIAISAVCSFLFVAAFPSDAIDWHAEISEPQVTEIARAWKGVFAHKNVLGHVMSVGVIVELYIESAQRIERSGTPFALRMFRACDPFSFQHRNTSRVLLPGWSKLFFPVAARKRIFWRRFGDIHCFRGDDLGYLLDRTKFCLWISGK